MSNPYNGLHVNFPQVTLLSRRWAHQHVIFPWKEQSSWFLWLGFEDVASAASLLLPISTSFYPW
jgi:hypothetical protein